MQTYHNAKLRSFGLFFLTFLRSTELHACARQRWSAGQIELVCVLESLHWQYFPKKLGAVWFAGYRRAAWSQEERKAVSRRVANWVEKVDCVTLICEDRRLAALAFWNQLRNAHCSSLPSHCYVKETWTLVVGLTPATVLTQSRTLVESSPFYCRRQFGSQFVLCWTFNRAWLKEDTFFDSFSLK